MSNYKKAAKKYQWGVNTTVNGIPHLNNTQDLIKYSLSKMKYAPKEMQEALKELEIGLSYIETGLTALNGVNTTGMAEHLDFLETTLLENTTELWMRSK